MLGNLEVIASSVLSGGPEERLSRREKKGWLNRHSTLRKIASVVLVAASLSTVAYVAANKALAPPRSLSSGGDLIGLIDDEDAGIATMVATTSEPNLGVRHVDVDGDRATVFADCLAGTPPDGRVVHMPSGVNVRVDVVCSAGADSPIVAAIPRPNRPQ